MTNILERGMGAPSTADQGEVNLWDNVDEAVERFGKQVEDIHNRYQEARDKGGRAEIEERHAIDRDALSTVREMYRLLEYIPMKFSTAQQRDNLEKLQKLYLDLIAEIPTVDDMVALLREEAQEACHHRLEKPTDPEGELRIRSLRAFIQEGVRKYLRMRPEFDYSSDASQEVKDARDAKLKESLAKLDALMEELPAVS